VEGPERSPPRSKRDIETRADVQRRTPARTMNLPRRTWYCSRNG
jgi:hypothetical protein